MANNFELAITFTGLHEWRNDPDGMYHCDPADPGGETKYGIAKKSHPLVDIKNLTLEGALDIYRREYWVANNLDSVVLPLCIAYFDSYVQHGAGTVKRLIQQGGGDLRAFIEARRQFYKGLEIRNPEEVKFDGGWMNRCNDLSKYCDIVMQQEN